MIETENQEKEQVEEENLPQSTDTQPVDVLNRIQNVISKEELMDVTALFNLSITKKEMQRALQQDELLDLILKQVSDRIKKRPDEISTSDLLEYMKAFQNNIDKTQDYIDRVESTPAIQVTDNKKVIVNIGTITRDSSENILEAVNQLIQSVGDKNTLEELMSSVQIADINEEKKDD